MSRIVIALVALTSVAHAQTPEPSPTPPAAPAPTEPTAPTEAPPPWTQPATPAEPTAPTVPPAAEAVTATSPSDGASAPPDMADQAIDASLGIAVGGRTTAGGLRIAGSYLYQLSQQDWFDGTASFVFGGNGPECFRDRMDETICEHGLADGYSVTVSANVRRFLMGQGRFWPFIRAGLGASLVRFGGDDITGFGLPLHVGGGLRVSASDFIAIVGQAELDVGIGWFSNGAGTEPQFGLNVSAGVEFRL